jgi:hypothetical protein
MLNEPWFALVIIIGILAVIGKCLEMKYYHDKFRLLREELKDSILGNTNYIRFDNPEDSI